MQSKKISFLAVFLFILKISFIGFGGGNAIMPVIKSEIVKQKKWITSEEFDHILIVTNSLPGASVIQTISYISIKLLGKLKGILVTLIAFIPHLIFALLILKLFKFVPLKYINYIAIGTLISIIVLLFNFGVSYLKQAKTTINLPVWLAIFVFTFTYNIFIPAPFNLPVIPIVLLIITYSLFYFLKRRKENKVC
ncbi:chromate transporter [Mycoplasmopsis glycophila]|uniref:Chromate transporter n=1 Tax=Mycoplasmopsis glycophila TaxID=171285 RepID=A0A449AW40_9BACT|nr:chromate transporter [Mycoplasmopsis glycophila]VEU70849.1 chromate transporter [Mycoplasmopsis glycophila]